MAQEEHHDERPLQTWKDIATYLERDVRTAMRWEKNAGLPIRRHSGAKGSSVYAYPSEIEAWRTGRSLSPPEAAAPPRPSRRWIWGALAAAVIAGLLLAGPIFNPPNPLADAASRSGAMVTRQIWAGGGVDARGEVSPNGRFLAYIDWNRANLMLRDLDSGKARLLFDGKNWAEGYPFMARFSPDGKQIAFMWEDYSDAKNIVHEIRLISVGTEGQPGEIRTLRAGARALQWSRDGRNLLVQDSVNGEIRIGLVSVATGKLEPIKTVGWDVPNPILSPDGRFVAYDLPHEPGAENRDVHLVATDGSFETTLVEHPAHDTVITWDPGGSRLFFLSNRDGDSNLYALPILNGRSAGPPVTVRSGVGAMEPLGMTADGRLFYSTPVGASRISLVEIPRLNDAAYSPKLLSSTIRGEQSDPVFSPDGRLLAYLVEQPRAKAIGDPPRVRLVIRDLESGADRVVDSEAVGLRVSDLPPGAFSPDGRRILAVGYSPAKRRRIVATIDAATGKATPIRTLGGKEYMYPTGWLDESTVAVRNQVVREENGVSEVRSVIMRLDARTGETQDVFMRGRLLGDGSLSPDRRHVAFPEWLGPKEQRSTQVTVIPMDGSSPRTLLSFGLRELFSFPLVFSPDGRQVHFTQINPEGRAELQRMPFDGGEAEPAGLTFEDDTVWRLAMHPDGRRMAIHAGRARLEIWALENFLGSPTK